MGAKFDELDKEEKDKLVRQYRERVSYTLCKVQEIREELQKYLRLKSRGDLTEKQRKQLERYWKNSKSEFLYYKDWTKKYAEFLASYGRENKYLSIAKSAGKTISGIVFHGLDNSIDLAEAVATMRNLEKAIKDLKRCK